MRKEREEKRNKDWRDRDRLTERKKERVKEKNKEREIKHKVSNDYE